MVPPAAWLTLKDDEEERKLNQILFPFFYYVCWSSLGGQHFISNLLRTLDSFTPVPPLDGPVEDPLGTRGNHMELTPTLSPWRRFIMQSDSFNRIP